MMMPSGTGSTIYHWHRLPLPSPLLVWTNLNEQYLWVSSRGHQRPVCVVGQEPSGLPPSLSDGDRLLVNSVVQSSTYLLLIGYLLFYLFLHLFNNENKKRDGFKENELDCPLTLFAYLSTHFSLCPFPQIQTQTKPYSCHSRLAPHSFPPSLPPAAPHSFPFPLPLPLSPVLRPTVCGIPGHQGQGPFKNDPGGPNEHIYHTPNTAATGTNTWQHPQIHG
jgi:hypothetical protein